MEELTRNINGRERTFPIYTREEAEDLGLFFVHWREARLGEWALTDDGYVCEVVKRGDYLRKGGGKKKRISLITLPMGRRWANGKASFHWEELRKQGGGYYLTKAQRWDQAETARERGRRTVMAYVQMLASGKEIDYEVLGNLYRPKQEIPKASVKRFLKTRAARTMVKEELKALISRHGIDEDYVAKNLVRVIDEAYSMDRPDLTNVNRALDAMRDMLDMKPDKEDGSREEYAEAELDFSGFATIMQNHTAEANKLLSPQAQEEESK